MKKVFAVFATLALMAGSAYAADWNFYGSARIATFWSDVDTISGASGDVTFSESLQGNSRIGANVKVSDELTGRFEYGTGVNVRILYGEWNFGAGTLLVGQTYTPLNLFYSNQVYGSDNDMLGQGGVYSGREPMLRLKFSGFQIAFLAPKTTVTGGGSNEVVMPAIEAKYSLHLDNFSLAVAGGYSTFETTTGGKDYDVDSYVLAVGAKFSIAGFFVAGDTYFGQNPGNLIGISVDGDNNWGDGFAAIAGGDVVDNDCFGLLLVAGYKISDAFTIEAGYGYVQSELDDVDDKCSAYYVQAPITLASGVYITPEVGFFAGDEDGDKETLYYGMKWQINF